MGTYGVFACVVPALIYKFEECRYFRGWGNTIFPVMACAIGIMLFW